MPRTTSSRTPLRSPDSGAPRKPSRRLVHRDGRVSASHSLESPIAEALPHSESDPALGEIAPNWSRSAPYGPRLTALMAWSKLFSRLLTRLSFFYPSSTFFYLLLPSSTFFYLLLPSTSFYLLLPSSTFFYLLCTFFSAIAVQIDNFVERDSTDVGHGTCKCLLHDPGQARRQHVATNQRDLNLESRDRPSHNNSVDCSLHGERLAMNDQHAQKCAAGAVEQRKHK